jgi:hypothetical protein
MRHQTIVIVLCVVCLGATMILVERLRLRQGYKLPKVRRWLTRTIKAFQVIAVCLAGPGETLAGIDVCRSAPHEIALRKLPEMREPRFLV